MQMKRGSRRTIAALAAATCLLMATGALAYVAHHPGSADGGGTKSLSVRSFGAKGDGKADDTRAFMKALKAAAGSRRRLFVPSGVYRLRPLTVPDGVRITGAGRRTTWLRGSLAFGSAQSFSDLLIGDAGVSAVHNRKGATNTVFERCRLRGGGGTSVDEAVVGLGYRGDCADIHFRDCEVECNLGIENAGFTNAFNDITVYETTGAHVRGITFEGCHVGVSNGVRTGSPRMGLECYTVQVSEGGSGRGYEDITVRDCTFEATDLHCIDLADAADGRARGVLIEGCLLKGGGKAQVKWGYTICVESPSGVVIRNNTIWRGNWQTLNFAHSHESGPGTLVTGNSFDLKHENGIPMGEYNPIFITGEHVELVDNTISFAGPHQYIIQLNNASHCTITGNTFEIGTREISQTYNVCSGNTIADNIVR
jgi:hypothetical protein